MQVRAIFGDVRHSGTAHAQTIGLQQLACSAAYMQSSRDSVSPREAPQLQCVFWPWGLMVKYVTQMPSLLGHWQVCNLASLLRNLTFCCFLTPSVWLPVCRLPIIHCMCLLCVWQLPQRDDRCVA